MQSFTPAAFSGAGLWQRHIDRWPACNATSWSFAAILHFGSRCYVPSLLPSSSAKCLFLPFHYHAHIYIACNVLTLCGGLVTQCGMAVQVSCTNSSQVQLGSCQNAVLSSGGSWRYRRPGRSTSWTSLGEHMRQATCRGAIFTLEKKSRLKTSILN